MRDYRTVKNWIDWQRWGQRRRGDVKSPYVYIYLIV